MRRPERRALREHNGSKTHCVRHWHLSMNRKNKVTSRGVWIETLKSITIVLNGNQGTTNMKATDLSPYYCEEDRPDDESGIDPTIWLGIGDRFIFRNQMARVLRYLPRFDDRKVDAIEFEIIQDHPSEPPKPLTMSVDELTFIVQDACQSYRFRRPAPQHLREVIAVERRKRLVTVE